MSLISLLQVIIENLYQFDAEESGMWSKTKQVLTERMADSLKKRVRYNFEVYTTNKCHWWSETPVFYIYVDGERWFSTKLFYYLLKEAEYLHENVDRSLPYHEYWEAHIRAGSAACAYASKYGFMDVDSIMLCIHKYLNVYSARECLDSGNYILKLLAVLDRRIGKRTVKKLADNISNEPEWFRKFILLRAEGEGIHCRIEPNSKIT